MSVIANQKAGRCSIATALRERGIRGTLGRIQAHRDAQPTEVDRAEVTAEFGAVRQRQVVDGGMGFCSQNDRACTSDWANQRLGRVTIRWPSGTEQVLEGLRRTGCT